MAKRTCLQAIKRIEEAESPALETAADTTDIGISEADRVETELVEPELADADLVENPLNASSDEVAESDDCLDLAAIGREVIGHAGNDFSLIEFGFGDFMGHPKRAEYTVDPLCLKDSIGRARNFHRRPDSVPLFHEAVIDQILSQATAGRRVRKTSQAPATTRRAGRRGSVAAAMTANMEMAPGDPSGGHF